MWNFIAGGYQWKNYFNLNMYEFIFPKRVRAYGRVCTGDVSGVDNEFV